MPCPHHPHHTVAAAGAARPELMGPPWACASIPPWAGKRDQLSVMYQNLQGTWAEGLTQTKPDTAPTGSLGAIPMACVIYCDHQDDQNDLFVLQSTFSTCQVLSTKRTNQKTIDTWKAIKPWAWSLRGGSWTSFYICLEKEGTRPPASHPGHRRCHKALEKLFVILGGSRIHKVWQHPELPTTACVQQHLPLEIKSLEHQLEKRLKKKKVLKKWKNVASEHRALQSRKQIHNSSNLAPFHTTDGSTADVKCIYGVGTFPVASWGLGKISDLPERNCCLVRDEKFLVFFFHIYNSSFHLP